MADLADRLLETHAAGAARHQHAAQALFAALARRRSHEEWAQSAVIRRRTRHLRKLTGINAGSVIGDTLAAIADLCRLDP